MPFSLQFIPGRAVGPVTGSAAENGIGACPGIVPPESALLANEDRQKFFMLFDQDIAKYQPADPAEKAIVRELSECRWTHFRLTALRHEWVDNTRVIAQIERRLYFLQNTWPD